MSWQNYFILEWQIMTKLMCNAHVLKCGAEGGQSFLVFQKYNRFSVSFVLDLTGLFWQIFKHNFKMVEEYANKQWRRRKSWICTLILVALSRGAVKWSVRCHIRVFENCFFWHGLAWVAFTLTRAWQFCRAKWLLQLYPYILSYLGKSNVRIKLYGLYFPTLHEQCPQW